MPNLRANTISVIALALCTCPPDSYAREYVVPAGTNVARFFAELPEDATVVKFSDAVLYRCSEDIVLPDRRLLVVDGSGAELQLGPGSHGFTRIVMDQKEAMRRISSRYVIKDFGQITGGIKAIDLKATMGSRIENCRMVGQTEVAIDLRFCLLTHLEQVFVTNPQQRGIVLRHGDWPGATAFNSQSNSSVLVQCRVYCSKTTTEAFTVLNSGGVRMSDCVSEGAPCAYDLFLSARTDDDHTIPANNTVVKSFHLSNFHVEHAPTKASVFVNMPSKCTVTLSNVYWNGPQKAPVILYTMGQLNLEDIGWFRKDLMIHTRISAPRINVDRCHNQLQFGKKEERTSSNAGVLYLRNAIPGNEQLKLNYVRRAKPSM